MVDFLKSLMRSWALISTTMIRPGMYVFTYYIFDDDSGSFSRAGAYFCDMFGRFMKDHQGESTATGICSTTREGR